MKEYTFDTKIYDSIEKIPDCLPWKKCMVRYENKSPKDSELWGPISTKKQLEELFYTSLRCKTNPGKFYCIREWIELSNEYRCFWNNGLVAISSEDTIRPDIEKILDYIYRISSSVKYHRCVFDIAFIKETNELIFIEYNSWETNSGAHKFDWNDDKEIFYNGDCVVIRWNCGEERIKNKLFGLYVNNNDNNNNKFIMDNQIYKCVQNIYPSNYLITDKYIYISKDVWLGLFNHNLTPIKWIKGVFRFDYIELCIDGSICVGDKYYYSDLTPKRTKSKKTITNNYGKNITNYRYGIHIMNKNTLKTFFVRMLDSCELVLE